jgi:hypothetical protein
VLQLPAGSDGSPPKGPRVAVYVSLAALTTCSVRPFGELIRWMGTHTAVSLVVVGTFSLIVVNYQLLRGGLLKSINDVLSIRTRWYDGGKIVFTGCRPVLACAWHDAGRLIGCCRSTDRRAVNARPRGDSGTAIDAGHSDSTSATWWLLATMLVRLAVFVPVAGTQSAMLFISIDGLLVSVTLQAFRHAAAAHLVSAALAVSAILALRKVGDELRRSWLALRAMRVDVPSDSNLVLPELVVLLARTCALTLALAAAVVVEVHLWAYRVDVAMDSICLTAHPEVCQALRSQLQEGRVILTLVSASIVIYMALVPSGVGRSWDRLVRRLGSNGRRSMGNGSAPERLARAAGTALRVSGAALIGALLVGAALGIAFAAAVCGLALLAICAASTGSALVLRVALLLLRMVAGPVRALVDAASRGRDPIACVIAVVLEPDHSQPEVPS